MQMKLTAAKLRRCRCNVKCIWVAAPFPHGRHCVPASRSDPEPGPQTQNHPRQLRNMHESSNSRTTAIFGCIIASLNQWGASGCRWACCCCWRCTHTWLGRTSLSTPFAIAVAVSIGISATAATSTCNSISISIAIAISMSHVPSLVSMSVAVVVNICHDLIVKRSHVAALPTIAPLEPPPPHPWATAAVTWVQLFS